MRNDLKGVIGVGTSAALFSAAVIIWLFTKPRPPDYSRLPIDAAALSLTLFGLVVSAFVWRYYPRLRLLLVLVVLLAQVPIIHKILTMPFFGY